MLDKALTSVSKLESAYLAWKALPLASRKQTITRIQERLLTHTEEYASAITTDMNKPLAQSIAEVKKCASLCSYYLNHIDEFLRPQPLQSSWSESYVRLDPLGVLLAVMPWNFPFWQVFRVAIPNLLLGNVLAVKHASNVPTSAALLEEIFLDETLGFPIYKNLPLASQHVEAIIAHPAIKGVTLTGSEPAGRSVAQCAGKYLKKSVLELGGSAAFIVCEDADLNRAVATAVNARMQNAGQSCIAGKRILVQQSIAKAFIAAFTEKVKALKQGDKYDLSTEIGAMAREDLAIEIEEMVEQSLSEGATLLCGGKRTGAFYEPTVLTDVTPTMRVFREETFGPVAVITTFRDFEEAIALSNQSDFGLGVAIFSQNVDFVKSQAPRFDEGAVYINEMLISDPHLPFGGIKNSGYGRELSHFGVLEFANIKTVVVK